MNQEHLTHSISASVVIMIIIIISMYVEYEFTDKS